jgi:hypothetical protein
MTTCSENILTKGIKPHGSSYTDHIMSIARTHRTVRMLGKNVTSNMVRHKNDAITMLLETSPPSLAASPSTYACTIALSPSSSETSQRWRGKGCALGANWSNEWENRIERWKCACARVVSMCVCVCAHTCAFKGWNRCRLLGCAACKEARHVKTNIEIVVGAPIEPSWVLFTYYYIILQMKG